MDRRINIQSHGWMYIYMHIVNNTLNFFGCFFSGGGGGGGEMSVCSFLSCEVAMSQLQIVDAQI